MRAACRRSSSRTRCSSCFRAVMSRMLTTIPPMGSSRWLAATTSRSMGRPVGPDGPHLQGHRQSAPGHQVVEEGPDRLDAQGVEQREGVLADDVADVVAEQPLGRGADEDEPAVARRPPPPRRTPARRASGTRRLTTAAVAVPVPGGPRASGPTPFRAPVAADPGSEPPAGPGRPRRFELSLAGERPALELGHAAAPVGRPATGAGRRATARGPGGSAPRTGWRSPG